jgi:hypothetical protein
MKTRAFDLYLIFDRGPGDDLVHGRDLLTGAARGFTRTLCDSAAENKYPPHDAAAIWLPATNVGAMAI